MITKSEPLFIFVRKYEACGLQLNVYPTINGERFGIRVCDPKKPENGLGFVAAFAKSVKEAKRPEGHDAQKAATRQWNNILHSTAGAAFNVCTCVIDEESLAAYPQYTEEDLGTTFLMVCHANSVKSDDYEEAAETSKAEKKKKTAKAD